MREYDASRANAEKAELIRAAEVFKNYCLTHRSNECRDETSRCFLTPICDELSYYRNAHDVMVDVVQNVRDSDD